jgi:hypothetical protein
MWTQIFITADLAVLWFIVAITLVEIGSRKGS